MDEVRILHLSDIHFRKSTKKDNPGLRADVQEKLLETIEAHVKKHEPPEFVSITGDIAFSGKEEEYLLALKFINELKAKLPLETHYLVVPGNHDVDRDEIDEWVSVQEIFSEEKDISKFLADKNAVEKHISPKFMAFRDFAQTLDETFYPEITDLFWVKLFKEHGVAFLGLNSSWGSEKREEQLKIALGYPQLQEAIKRSKTMPVRIAMMHHPHFYYLKDLYKGRGRVELFRNCHLILHGHDHSDRAEVISNPSNSIIFLGSNASYTEDNGGRIGFQFISIIPQGNAVTARVWPYIFEESDNYRFINHRDRYESQNGEESFVISSFNQTLSQVSIPSNSLEIPSKYRNWIENIFSNIPIDKLAKKEEDPFSVSLSKVYIQLETYDNEYNEDDGEPVRKLNKQKSRLTDKVTEKSEIENINTDQKEFCSPPKVKIEVLLSQRHMIVLSGKHGMGKTTLVKHLAYSLVKGTVEPEIAGCLPVVVFLKEFWPILDGEIKKNGKVVDFLPLLDIYLKKTKCLLDINTTKEYLLQNRAIFLIDGIDEVPEDLRFDLVELIAHFCTEYSDNRFLITSRPNGIDNSVVRVWEKYCMDILPLSKSKTEEFVIKWFENICYYSHKVAQQHANELISEISLYEKDVQFFKEPLLLTAICVLYKYEKKLPDQRAELYEQVVDNLLYARFNDPKDRDRIYTVKDFLAHLAFRIQRDKTDFEIASAKQILKKHSTQQLEGNSRGIDKEFQEIELNCGLLKSKPNGYLEFFHSTFQGFMAAKYLIDKGFGIDSYLQDSRWEDTIIFYVGIRRRHSRIEGNNLVRKFFELDCGDLTQNHRYWLLGAQCLKEISEFRRDDVVVRQCLSILERIIRESKIIKTRSQAENLIRVLGDRRSKKNEMIEILEGEGC